MRKRQSTLGHIMKGLNMKWPSVYLDHASGPVLYGFQLHLYIQAVCKKHANMHEDLITSLKSIVTDITKLNKGIFHQRYFFILNLRS